MKFDTTVFSYFIYDGGLWFRLFGWGLSVADYVKNPPLFIEREDYKKVLRIGKWGVEIIRPPIADLWDTPASDPIKDCMLALTSMGYSEREGEIFLETLMGEREYTIDLHFDLMTGKLRRSLEEKGEVR